MIAERNVYDNYIQGPKDHLTDHAQLEMTRRQIPASDVARALAIPEQMEMVRQGRVVYQTRGAWGTPPAIYLLRVFVDIDRQPPDVVTVYRTSKITKYGKGTSGLIIPRWPCDHGRSGRKKNIA